MSKKTILVLIAAVVIAGAGGFSAGLKYGQSKNKNNFFSARDSAGFFASTESGNGQPRMQIFNNGSGGTGAGRAMRVDDGFANGEILSKDDQSLTVKLRDGGSKIVFFSESTAVTKNASGSLAELKIGDTVTAIGPANPDGSITAESLQLRPAMPNPPTN